MPKWALLGEPWEKKKKKRNKKSQEARPAGEMGLYETGLSLGSISKRLR